MMSLWKISAFLLIAALFHVSSADLQIRNRGRGASSVSSLSWAGRFEDDRLRVPRSSATRHVHKRQISLATLKPNQAHQPCLTPSGAQGRCRHLQYCILEEFRNSFPRFLDYLCVIERSFVGVCCPERPELGGLLPPSSIAGLLPSVAGQPEGGSPAEGGDSPPSDPAAQRPKARGCGVSFRSSTAAPTDGGMADPGEWPWVAALLNEDELQFCGGVLLTDRHVLTASHCLFKKKVENLLVRLGEYDLENINETRSQDFKVAQMTLHENYQDGTYENDIAILKLERPAAFNSYIWPVCLPPLDDDFENATAVVAGWGTLSYGGPPSDVLMEVSVPVWPQDKCASQYAQPIMDYNMCAGGYEGDKDACQGDSGGPILMQMDNKQWATIGVVSWGIRCGEPTHPGVYIRVNHFLPWILKNCDF